MKFILIKSPVYKQNTEPKKWHSENWVCVNDIKAIEPHDDGTCQIITSKNCYQSEFPAYKLAELLNRTIQDTHKELYDEANKLINQSGDRSMGKGLGMLKVLKAFEEIL